MKQQITEKEENLSLGKKNAHVSVVTLIKHEQSCKILYIISAIL